METLATEKVEIVSKEFKVCKRDKRFEGWVFSIAFVPIVFIDDNALCMVLNYVHCPATTPMSQRLLSQRDGSGSSPLAVME